MAYPNLLDIPGGLTIAEMQAQQIEKYNQQAKAKK